MTLIAGFREQGVPILVGDFLITADGKESGTKKKICRITEKFAIGWTGSLVAAQFVVSRLREVLYGRRPSLSDVERVLTAFRPSDFGAASVHLIGWCLGPPDTCFLWNSGWPGQLFDGPYHYDGSGHQHFRAISGVGGSKFGDLDVEPLRTVVQSTALLMMDEVASRSNRAKGFGYAYEILYAKESQFHYFDDLTWIFLQARFSASRKLLKTEFFPPLISLYSFDELSVVQIEDPRRGTIERNVSTPAFSVERNHLDAFTNGLVKPGAVPRAGAKLCLAIDMVRDADTASAVSISPVVVVRFHGDPPKAFELLDLKFTPTGKGGATGNFEIRVPGDDTLEWMFRAMVGDPDLNGSDSTKGTERGDNPPSATSGTAENPRNSLIRLSRRSEPGWRNWQTHRT